MYKLTLVQKKPLLTPDEYPQDTLLIFGNYGPPGPSSIGGFPIDVEDLEKGDLLIFETQNWTNTNKINITDGGNF